MGLLGLRLLPHGHHVNSRWCILTSFVSTQFFNLSGYGDMSCQTVLGKIAITLFILVGLVSISYLIKTSISVIRQCLPQASRKLLNWLGLTRSMRAPTRRKQGEGFLKTISLKLTKKMKIYFVHQARYCLWKHFLRDSVKLPEGFSPWGPGECRCWSGFPPQVFWGQIWYWVWMCFLSVRPQIWIWKGFWRSDTQESNIFKDL